MAAAANMEATEEKVTIKRTQAGEDKEYWNFICAMLKPNNPFNSFQEFDNAKKSLHKMKNQGLWEAYGQMMVKHARFREVPGCSAPFSVVQGCSAQFRGYSGDIQGDSTNPVLNFEFCKFCKFCTE